MRISDIMKRGWPVCGGGDDEECGESLCTDHGFDVEPVNPALVGELEDGKVHAAECHNEKAPKKGARFAFRGVKIQAVGQVDEYSAEAHYHFYTESLPRQCMNEVLAIRDAMVKILFGVWERVSSETGIKDPVTRAEDVLDLLRIPEKAKILWGWMDPYSDEIWAALDRTHIYLNNVPNGITVRAVDYDSGDWLVLDSTQAGEEPSDHITQLQVEDQERYFRAVARSNPAIKVQAVETTDPFKPGSFPTTTAYGLNWSFRIGKDVGMNKIHILAVPREFRGALSLMYQEKQAFMRDGQFRNMDTPQTENLEIWVPDIWKTKDLLNELQEPLSET